VPDQNDHNTDDDIREIIDKINDDNSEENKEAEEKTKEFKATCDQAARVAAGGPMLRSRGSNLSAHFNPTQLKALAKVQFPKLSNKEKKEIRTELARFLRTKEIDLDRLIMKVKQAKYSGENFVDFILDPANEIKIKEDGTKVLVFKTAAHILKKFLFQPITQPMVDFYNCLLDYECAMVLRKCEVLGSPDEIVHSFTMPLLNKELGGVGGFCSLGGDKNFEGLKVTCKSKHQEDIDNTMSTYVASMRVYHTNKPPQLDPRKYLNVEDVDKQLPLALSGPLRSNSGDPKLKKSTRRAVQQGRSNVWDPCHPCTTRKRGGQKYNKRECGNWKRKNRRRKVPTIPAGTTKTCDGSTKPATTPKPANPITTRATTTTRAPVATTTARPATTTQARPVVKCKGRKCRKKKGGKKKRKPTGKNITDMFLCNGWKCKKNPNFPWAEHNARPKEVGDLHNKFGKISAVELSEMLTQTHGTDLQDFTKLDISGNMVTWERDDNCTGPDCKNDLRDLFCLMPNLKEINLANTMLMQYLPEDTFQCTQLLEHLDLAENGLFCVKNILDQQFESKQIVHLNLDSNPVKARCYFKKKWNWKQKWETIAQVFDKNTFVKRRIVEDGGKNDDFNEVLQECINQEPNCISWTPDFDEALFFR